MLVAPDGVTLISNLVKIDKLFFKISKRTHRYTHLPTIYRCYKKA